MTPAEAFGLFVSAGALGLTVVGMLWSLAAKLARVETRVEAFTEDADALRAQLQAVQVQLTDLRVQVAALPAELARGPVRGQRTSDRVVRPLRDNSPRAGDRRRPRSATDVRRRTPRRQFFHNIFHNTGLRISVLPCFSWSG